MRKTFALAILAVLFMVICIISKNIADKPVLIKKVVTPDGISVTYKDNNGVWGLDYLTKKEFDSLFN